MVESFPSFLEFSSIGKIMEISYKKLWHILVDRNMTKTDLMQAAKLSWGSISKLNRGENIGTDLLLRICNVLECNLSDIVETVESEKKESTK